MNRRDDFYNCRVNFYAKSYLFIRRKSRRFSYPWINGYRCFRAEIDLSTVGFYQRVPSFSTRSSPGQSRRAVHPSFRQHGQRHRRSAKRGNLRRFRATNFNFQFLPERRLADHAIASSMSTVSTASASKRKLIENDRVTKFQYLGVGDSRVRHVSVHSTPAVPGRTLFPDIIIESKCRDTKRVGKLNLLRLRCPRRQSRNSPTLRCRASRCSCTLATLHKLRKLAEPRQPRAAT